MDENTDVLRSSSEPHVVLTTSADKRHLTIVLTETADGKMPPPIIISKENDELPNMYIIQALSSRLKRKG